MGVLYDYLCVECGYSEERLVDFEERDTVFDCPNCEGKLERHWLNAPSMGNFANEASDQTIEARKRSFRQRFIKKEITDVRHKFGRLYDDSIRSAAAQRIENEEEA